MMGNDEKATSSVIGNDEKAMAPMRSVLGGSVWGDAIFGGLVWVDRSSVGCDWSGWISLRW